MSAEKGFIIKRLAAAAATAGILDMVATASSIADQPPPVPSIVRLHATTLDPASVETPRQLKNLYDCDPHPAIAVPVAGDKSVSLLAVNCGETTMFPVVPNDKNGKPLPTFIGADSVDRGEDHSNGTMSEPPCTFVVYKFKADPLSLTAHTEKIC